MPDGKYYDYTTDRPLDLDEDGCDWVDWSRLYGNRRFARHPKGFKVFLSPDKLVVSDEYAQADPYSVEQGIDSDFHARRIEITVELVREALAQRGQGAEILDIGCGQGHITERIRQAVSGAKVTGLDYSVSAIQYAHEHFPEIDFSVGDAYECPYKQGLFDVVVCNNLWEHVPDPLFLLSRIKRSVKPGGHLIISTPSRYRLGNLLRVMMGKTVLFMSQHHVTEYSVGQVKEQLAYGGFEVRKVASKPISAGSLKANIARKLLSSIVSITGSHHQLEATVFYLAKSTLVETLSDGATAK